MAPATPTDPPEREGKVGPTHESEASGMRFGEPFGMRRRLLKKRGRDLLPGRYAELAMQSAMTMTP